MSEAPREETGQSIRQLIDADKVFAARDDTGARRVRLEHAVWFRLRPRQRAKLSPEAVREAVAQYVGELPNTRHRYTDAYLVGNLRYSHDNEAVVLADFRKRMPSTSWDVRGVAVCDDRKQRVEIRSLGVVPRSMPDSLAPPGHPPDEWMGYESDSWYTDGGEGITRGLLESISFRELHIELQEMLGEDCAVQRVIATLTGDRSSPALDMAGTAVAVTKRSTGKVGRPSQDQTELSRYAVRYIELSSVRGRGDPSIYVTLANEFRFPNGKPRSPKTMPSWTRRAIEHGYLAAVENGQYAAEPRSVL